MVHVARRDFFLPEVINNRNNQSALLPAGQLFPMSLWRFHIRMLMNFAGKDFFLDGIAMSSAISAAPFLQMKAQASSSVRSRGVRRYFTASAAGLLRGVRVPATLLSC